MRVSLRLATLSDIPFLWYLRERPYVRKVSRNKKPISWSQHVQWVVPVVLGLAAKQLYVIEANGIAAGQIRFDFKDTREAEVNISLLKELQGKGIGSKALAQGIKVMKKQNVKKLIALTHKNNGASQRLLEKAGFQQERPRSESPWLLYSLLLPS